MKRYLVICAVSLRCETEHTTVCRIVQFTDSPSSLKLKLLQQSTLLQNAAHWAGENGRSSAIRRIQRAKSVLVWLSRRVWNNYALIPRARTENSNSTSENSANCYKQLAWNFSETHCDLTTSCGGVGLQIKSTASWTKEISSIRCIIMHRQLLNGCHAFETNLQIITSTGRAELIKYYDTARNIYEKGCMEQKGGKLEKKERKNKGLWISLLQL